MDSIENMVILTAAIIVLIPFAIAGYLYLKAFEDYRPDDEGWDDGGEDVWFD